MSLGFPFGAPSTPATSGFSFGSTPAAKPAASGFTLNLAPATSAAPAVSGFSFGTATSSTAAPQAPTGLSFGTPAATQPSTVLFGGPAATSAFTGLYGPTAAPQGSSGVFGAPATTQTSTGLFGAPAATQASTALFGAPATSQPSGGLFGAPAATQASTGLFGAPATTQASTGLFGPTPAAAAGSGGFAAPAPSAAPASSAGFVGLGGKLQVGLGGMTTSGSAGISTTAANLGKADGKPAKESPLQDQIARTVEAFRTHVKAQKADCELISRHSWAPVKRVAEETTALRQLLSAAEASVQRHAAAAGKLKLDVCDSLKSAEVAQRTSEISAGLQYENTAPQQLFEQLVGRYEAAMVQYRRQIDQLERLLEGGPGSISPEELMRAIRQLHETFVWLAGHLQTVHEKVQALKEHYVTYRRTVLGEGASPVDIFPSAQSAASSSPERRPVLLGPSPFGVDSSATSVAVAQALGQTPRPAAAPAAPAQTPAPAGGLFGGAATSSLFGSPAPAFGAAVTASPFGAAVGSGLKLDPPPGSKRGKVN